MNLGSGAFGSVIADGDYAIKKFTELRCLINEVFVARYVDMVSNGSYAIHLKKCSFSKLTMTVERWHCSLDAAMKVGLTKNQCLSIHKCILKGLAIIEQIWIVHADLKPANVLVDHTYTKAVITDFGISSTSGSAKVKLTSPAFSPLKNGVKNHRTHDAFALVLLTMQLFYGYKINRVIETKAELRRIITATVTDLKMRNVLIMLVQEDETKSWTCRMALMELYDEDVYQPLPVIDIYKPPNPNPRVDNIVNACVNHLRIKYYINKSLRCTQCITSLVSRLDLSEKKIKIYASTMMYMFFCIFGTYEWIEKTKRIKSTDVLSYAACTEKDLTTCLNTVMSHDDIVELMFAP
jgi:serine/threonine protein kinase